MLGKKRSPPTGVPSGARFARALGFGYLRWLMSFIAKDWLAAGAVVGCVMFASACASRHVPLGGSVGQEPPNLLAGIVVPLAVQSYDVSTADGERGVFFKLSRVPDGIQERHTSDPARIILDVAGPATGPDIAPQSFPGTDTVVSQIQMSRIRGQLHIVLDLAMADLPKYSVRQMADWIVVRIEAAK
jgi:hypothetical protein